MSREADLVLLKLIENDKEVISQMNKRIDDLSDKFEYFRKLRHEDHDMLNGIQYLTTSHTEQISQAIDLIQDNRKRLEEMARKEDLRELKVQTRKEILQPILNFLTHRAVLTTIFGIFVVHETMPSISGGVGAFLKNLPKHW